MIREELPDATIIAFWHIPWPNPESFAICPWRDEVLAGLLGSSILGFHTQFHCNNFVDTVDRFLEARVDRESFTVSYRSRQRRTVGELRADLQHGRADQCRHPVVDTLGSGILKADRWRITPRL